MVKFIWLRNVAICTELIKYMGPLMDPQWFEVVELYHVNVML